MYGWIWRRLPFGLPGRLTGTVLLMASVVALLWYVVFPWAEPLLPFDDVQVTQEGGVPGSDPGFGDSGDPGVGGTPDPRESGMDDHDIPYSTDTDPSPSETD